MDQSEWPTTRREEALQSVLSLVDEKDTAAMKAAVGSFLLRENPFPLTQEDKDFETYWRLRAVSSPVLAKVALKVGSISPSEAAVERAFSHLKLLHSKLRNRLHERSVDVLMFVRMNAVPLGIIWR